MRTPSPESSHRLGETAFFTAAFLLPLAFFFRTYDTDAIKYAILQWSALAMAFAWLWQGLSRGRFAAPASAWPALLPALGYGAWMIVRFASSPYKVAALPDFLTQLTMLAAYLAAFLGFAGARSAARFAGLVVLSAWIVALYGLLQAAGLDPLMWKGVFGPGPIGSRVFSTLGNPYLCAAFLSIAAPVALTIDLDADAPRTFRLGALVLVPIAGFVVLLTGSPMGAFVYAAACLAYAVVVPAALRTPAALKSAGLAALAALCVGGASLALESTPARREKWSYALEFQKLTAGAELRMLADRPLTGFGPGSFSIHYPRYRPEAAIKMESGHNTMTEYPELPVLGAAVELGAVGLLLWLWMFGAALWTAARGAGDLRRAGALSESVYAAGLASAAAGGLAAAHFGFSGYLPAPGWFVWPAAGLAAGLAQLAVRRAPVSVYPLPVSEDVRRALYAPSLIAFAALAVLPGAWLRSDVVFNEGVIAAKSRGYESAVALFSGVRPGSRNWAMAQYFKGNALLDMDRPADAIAAYDRLQEQAPDYVLVHAQRGAAYAKLGDWTAAASERSRQAELDPLYFENLLAWSEAARSAGDLPQARLAVEKAASVNADDDRLRIARAANDLAERRLAERGGRKPNGHGTARKPR